MELPKVEAQKSEHKSAFFLTLWMGKKIFFLVNRSNVVISRDGFFLYRETSLSAVLADGGAQDGRATQPIRSADACGNEG